MQIDFVRSARLGTASLLVGLGAIALAGARIAAPSDGDNQRDAEVQRLRAHFDSVDSELRVRDVSHLTSSQLTQRQRLTAWLVEYRNAGVFPVNDRFPGRMVPFFRDSKGTLCAMAYLIDRSGRRDIVERIAQNQNNAFIPDLATDPQLAAWLKSSGLDVREAARIQPTYGGFIPNTDNRVTSDFAIATLALGGASLAAATVNVVSPGVVSEIVGLFVGGGAVLHGATHLDENRGTKRVANASIIAGSLSLAASIGAFFVSKTREHPNRSTTEVSHQESRVMITPVIVPASTRYQLGLAATARF